MIVVVGLAALAIGLVVGAVVARAAYLDRMEEPERPWRPVSDRRMARLHIVEPDRSEVLRRWH